MEIIPTSKIVIQVVAQVVNISKESAYSLNLEEVELQLMQTKYHVSQKQLWVYWLDYLKSSGQLFVLWN